MEVNPFDTIGLTVMFVLWAILLLWLVIGSRGWWWLKATIIAGTLFFGLGVWYSVDSYLGWATYHDPPRKFLVEWAVVNEPNKVTGQAGSVHLLLKKVPHEDDDKIMTWQDRYLAFIGYQGDDEEPRLYIRPYTRPLHQAANQINSMRGKGKMVVGEFQNGKLGQQGDGNDGEGNDGEGNDGEGNDGEGNGNGRPTLNRQPDVEGGEGRGFGGDNQGMGDFIFYELPPPRYMPKEMGLNPDA